MGLGEIAAGLELTETQEESGVATVDTTDASLADRLAPFAEDLPCEPTAAATLLEGYTAGSAVGPAARAAGLTPMTGAKTLHRLGESVSPVSPVGREVVADWIAGELSRTEALELTRLSESEFALAVYVETHDPLEAACAAVEGVLAARDTLDRGLADAVGGPTDL